MQTMVGERSVATEREKMEEIERERGRGRERAGIRAPGSAEEDLMARGEHD